MKKSFSVILLSTFLPFYLSTFLYSQSYVEEIYGEGVKQFQDGNYKSAIEKFDAAISTATKKEKDFLKKAYLYRADSMSELLQLDDALKEYVRITEKFPNTNESIRARLGIGLVYYKKNSYEKAREYFLNFVKRFPDTKITDDAQYWVGMLHFKNKNFKKAAVSFTALVQNYPKSDYAADGWLRLGDSYFNLKKYKQARNSYRKIITKYPASPQSEFALYGIGRVYETEGAVFDAISVYVQFAEKYPTSQLSPEITYQIAEYFYKKKDYAQAAKYFEQIYSNFPEHNLAEEANFMRSKIYYKTGAWTDAINSLQKFIEEYPLSKNYAAAMLYSGNCYLESSDYQKAIESYNTGLKLETSDPEIFAMMKYNSGVAYEKTGNTLEAEKCYSEILYRYPKSLAAAEMYLRRGSEFERSGDYFAAIENYELAATLSKNKGIGKAERTNGLLNTADEDMGAIAQKKAADCYFMQKKYKEAAREYLKVVYLFSDSQYVPESHYMSARASEEIGFIKDAKQNYEIVKKRYSDTEWAKKATERLQELNKK
ncbi:MAG: tol-pal system protein YbgF [Elusimicrobia bacterium]|nr:tol-pal system protein YbgF [Elusimicrobiota bacterium]